MRVWFSLVALLSLAACSSAPTPVATKEPEKPPEPLTGREAFYQTYPAARTWANDCQGLQIRSFNLDKVKSEAGKAGAWEIQYVSPAKGRQRTYTWSAIEAEGNLHKGVFAGSDDAWRGPSGAERPFLAAAIRIDTPEALATAIKNSPTYFKTPAGKPPVHYNLEFTTRFPEPVWRIYWGDAVSTAEWSVFVDASTGEYKGR